VPEPGKTRFYDRRNSRRIARDSKRDHRIGRGRGYLVGEWIKEDLY
jgi:hypothetical protein